MAYGSKDGVAALTRMWTDNGQFTGNTNPTDTLVENWLIQVSSMMDTSLAVSGFVVPITNKTITPMLDLFVNSLVKDLCHASNSSGRFFTERSLDAGKSWFGTLGNDITDWVIGNAAGLEAMGAERIGSKKDSIGFRDTDNSGNKTFPIFQREGFGNQFQDWDEK